VELFDLHLERVNHSNEVKEMRLVTNVVELYKAQPFGTYGGSHTYAKQLSLLIPEHKVYVEPFAGAAALLHAKKISDKEVLADYDDDVVFLHRFIKGMTEEKLDKLRAFNWKCTKSSWASVLKMEPKNEFERFYRLAFIRRFGYNSRPNATHPSGSALGTTNKLDKYLPAAERLKNVSIVKQDYHKTIADYDGPDTFFFIDPPYPGEWWNKSAVIDLEDFIETLKKIKGRYVAVINDAPDNVSAFKQNGQVFWLNINEALGTGGTKKASRLFCANYKISKKADVIHAQKAVEQGSITIGEFFYQPKPTRPAYPGERQSVDGLIKLYGDHPDWLPTIAQKKYDGCLPWYAKVETELGSVPIGRLVETKARIRVKSYSFEREVVEWKSITDHFYNGKAEGYLRIAVSGNRGTLTCTPNHFVFLADGSKVEAESLRVGNCICFRSARLSEQQESFIRGTLLGDSCLCRNLSKTFPSLPLLTCSHGSKQGEYLEWKASILASLGGRVSSRVSQYGFPGLRWISRSDAALLKFWDELYPDGKKRITAEFLSKLSPVSWATWIMDDGSLAWNVKPRLHLHTEGYSRAENELIKKYFEEFGCCVSVYEQRGYFFLAFSSGSTEWLLEQVRPWFHQSLAYKAGEVSGKLGTSWNDTVIFNGEQVSAREIVNIEPFVPARERGRYDIEVEGNHNYFVNGILVSNSNHQIHKDGDKVTIYSEDGDDNTDRLPGVVDAVRKLAPAKLVIVAEIERWQAGQHLPRETVAGYLNSKDEPDDSELVANVYDVLVQNDEQLHKEGTSKRIDALGKLKLGQSTTGVPNLKFRLNAAPSEVVEDLEDLRKTTERYRRLPGSEGAVFKQSDAPYAIAQVTPDTWVKFHNSTEVHGIVCGRERTEGGVWVYQYGILPGKDDPVETEDVGGKKVVPVGDSFATKLDIADGDPITIEAETVNIERSKDGIAVSAWVPRVIDTAPKPPDTVDKLSARARADLVLQEKDLAESGEIRYRPVHRAQVSKRKTAAAMLIELGPPSEWSGAVASAIGDDGRKRVKALWNALNESERKKVSEAFDKMFDATDVILDIEQSHGKIAKRLVTKQADPYLEVPPEGRKYQYSVQHHWRGKGFHADLRLEMKPGKLLAGWTLNTMITGVVKEPVTTLADAKAAVSDMNKVSKINWDTGEWAKRPKAGTDKLVRAEILCFAGSMEVLTRQGFRPIANVKVGDEVLSVDGGFHRVGGVMRRPAPKRLFDVKVRGVERLRATPEHPMLAVRRPFEEALDQLSQPRRDELFGKLATAVPEWLPISELRSGDYLVCPRPKFQADVSPVRLRDRNGYRKEIKVTPSFLRFVGFWIGDGSATNGNVIRLYFNGRTERALAEEYLSILEEIECSPTIHQRDPSHLTVQLHDPTLARWLVKNCGSGTQYKTIPEQWLGLDEANWSSLWQGLVDSDGWRDAHAEHLSNTSKLLIGRTIAQWHFLGVDVSYRLRSQLGYGTNKIYQLSHLSEKIGRMNVVTENHVLRRVLSVEEFSRTDATRRIDEVFNLEVEDSQTYTVHSIGVHNCERKAPEPYAWLHVEGKTKDPEEGQAPPVGGTRQYPGVFHIVDQGSFEYGSQKSWFHEYFFHGDALNYRMFFRLLRIAKRDEQLECAACGQSGPATLIGWAGEELTSMCPTCVDEFVSKQGVVLPPSEEQPIGDQSSWLAIYPDDQLPYVLDAEAVKKEWMPPDGYSALPAAMRSKIPPQYRYWTKSGNSARTIRDELVQAMKDGDIVIDAAAPFEKVRKASLLDADFVFQEQTWKGQTQVRIGPSRTRWWVRLDVGKPKLMVFDLATNPLDNDQVAAVVTEDPRKATMEVSGDVPPGHYMNPTKQTSSQVEVVDSGKASVTTLSDDLIKVQFDGKALKGVYTLTRNNGEYLWSKAKGAPDTTEKRVSEVEIQFVIPIHHVEVKKSADGTEKRLVTGIALEPNETDAQGDWIKAEAIEKTAHDFLRNYNKTTGMGLMHKAFGDIGIELVESSIAPFDYKVGVKPVKKGSWVVTVHVSSDKRWEEVKNGTLTGFSVGGLATVEGKS
jgi:site-specific DNA-adenine methylase